MADRPAVRTVPNVEIMQIGTWPASTGPVSWTIHDFLSAIAAFDDPCYTSPVLKLGHVDPRFDGQPALGRLANPRLSEDKQTFIVDLVGVPTWLADLIDGTAAFPSRSVEGSFDFKTPTGTKHDFALTALSLLGIAAPAVSTLADVAMLYGLDPVEVAASTPTVPKEEPMPQRGTVEVEASVSMDQVRQNFYTSPLLEQLGPWSWVAQVYSDFLIVDDDSGNLFKVPWSEGKGSTVTYGTPVRQTVEYKDAPPLAPGAANAMAAALGGNLRAAIEAHTPEPSPAPEPHTPAAPEPSGQTEREGGAVAFELNDEQAKALRKRLGLAEDATDDDVAAALAAPAPPSEEHSTDQTITGVPAGSVILDSASYEELRTMATRGDEAARRLANSDRDQVLEVAATTEGKFPRSRIDHWKAVWDKDPEGTRAYIAAMAKNVVPVTLRGYTGTDEDPDFDEQFSHLYPPKEA